MCVYIFWYISPATWYISNPQTLVILCEWMWILYRNYEYVSESFTKSPWSRRHNKATASSAADKFNLIYTSRRTALPQLNFQQPADRSGRRQSVNTRPKTPPDVPVPSLEISQSDKQTAEWWPPRNSARCLATRTLCMPYPELRWVGKYLPAKGQDGIGANLHLVTYSQGGCIAMSTFYPLDTVRSRLQRKFTQGFNNRTVTNHHPISGPRFDNSYRRTY